MPIDPYAALNAMIRAEAARFSLPVRQAEAPAANTPAAPDAAPDAPLAAAGADAASTSERQRTAPADSTA